MYVFINGHKYDLTHFKHPIKISLHLYNNKDVTELFYSIHLPHFIEKLEKYKIS